MKIKIIIAIVFLFVAYCAYALIIAEIKCRRGILNMRAAVYILEGLRIAQNEYYLKHGKVAKDFSELTFPESQNNSLRELGNEYIVTKDSLRRMEEDESFFKYTYFTSDDRQVLLILMISNPKINRLNCWLYLDYIDKEGSIVIGGAPKHIDIATVKTNIKELGKADQKAPQFIDKFSLK